MDEQYYDPDDLAELEEDEIEAYCVSCKEKVEIEDPVAVWTSQGHPGTRGECPICGGTVFRLGHTYLHGSSKGPKAIRVIEPKAKKRAARAAYIMADITRSEFADKLGKDLENIGIKVWVDDGEETEDVEWAGGVHPALQQCTHLVIVLSGFSLKTSAIEEAWRYFLGQHKPVVIAQIEAVDPPDDLRSRPRFNFQENYKVAFRELVEALSR